MGHSAPRVRPSGSLMCSRSISTTVVLPLVVPCPPDCPFEQATLGGTCDKLCVEGGMCHTFHPFNIFPDNVTMRCTKACGSGPGDQVEGCALCAGRGVCRKCSQGMLGFTSLELSDDGSQCRNDVKAWLYVSLGVAFVLGAVVLTYLVHLSRRDTTNEVVLEKVLHRSEVARTELMPQLGDAGAAARSWTDVRAGDIVGRGAALYFHWLLFGMVVTFLLGSCSFIGYELSDFRRKVKASGTTCDYLSELGSASLQQWDRRDFHMPPAGPVVEGGDLPPGVAREAERVAEAERKAADPTPPMLSEGTTPLRPGATYFVLWVDKDPKAYAESMVEVFTREGMKVKGIHDDFETDPEKCVREAMAFAKGILSSSDEELVAVIHSRGETHCSLHRQIREFCSTNGKRVPFFAACTRAEPKEFEDNGCKMNICDKDRDAVKGAVVADFNRRRSLA